MKKLLIGILASSLILSTGTMTFARELSKTTENIQASKTLSSQDTNWSFDVDSGTLIITGPLDDNSTTWNEHRADIKSIVFEQGATNVPSLAFEAFPALSSVTIANTVTEIGSDAFASCQSLTSITIPNSITSIKNATFSLSSGLTSVSLPLSVTDIDYFAFYGCSSLTTIYYEGSEADRATMNIVLTEDDDQFFKNATWIYNHNDPAWSDIPLQPPTSPTYSSWAEPQVTFAEENNLIVDSLGNDYTKSITRTQIADLLVNMMEQYTGTDMEEASAETFTDSTSEAVLKAYEAGIISGKGEGIFDPEATATRQEIAIMIVNAIKVLEENTGESFVDHSLTSLEGFSDFEETSDWAQNHVAILANNGIMAGSDGYLTPLSETSIQECLVLNNNLFTLSN